MADQRITQLTELTQAGVAANDVLPVSDVSASQTKKVTVKNLVQAGYDLSDSGSIDLVKLNQSSATKLGVEAIGAGAITANKLAGDSSIAVDTTAPITDNFEGRGYYNSATGVLQVYSAGAYANVTASVGTGAVGTTQLADGAVTTAKVAAAGLGSDAIADGAVTTGKLGASAVTAAKLATDAVTADAIALGAVGADELASNAVTYSKLQATSTTDVVLGRSSAGGGTVEEITCTSAGRAVIGAADAASQRTVLGLGTLATQSGTFTGTHSGTSSGTNTGDQTIQLTGDVTGIGTGSFAATIANDAITAAKISANAVTTVKLNDDAVTADKLANNSTTQTATGAPGGSGAFIGQEYINTANNISYYWDGTTWQNKSVSIPAATSSVSGTVKVGTGLQMNGSGQLDHLNTVTTGTFTKVTVDAQGHVTTGTTLVSGDVPNLDASKITTGTFSGNLFGTNSIAGAKLADSSTVLFGGAGSTSGVVNFPTAEFKGQYFYDELNQDLYIWSGSAWLPVTIISGELVLAGTYNANTNLVASRTSAGASAGLTVGSALPAASSTNNRYYLVVSDAGTGTGNAPAVALAPPDMILSTGSSWQLIDVSNTISGQTANNISFTPYGGIVATNVQTALQELDGDKLAVTGGTITGALTVGTTGSVVFEGSTDDAYETTLAVVDPTADRTITLPNVTGTVITTGDTGTVTSTMLADELPVSKLADGAARQLLQTDAAGTGVEWTNNIDIPGTLDVTGAAVFDSTVSITGTSTAGSFIPTSSTVPSNGLYLSAANQISLASNTTERIRFSSAGALGLGGANYGTSGQVLTSNGSGAAPTWQTVSGGGGGGDVFLASANAFTGANTFYNTTGQTFGTGTSTQDGIVLQGRAGGTTSLRVTLVPGTLTASRTLTLPNVTGTVVTTGDTGTVSNTMLANSAVTINSTAVSLGGSATVNTVNALTANSGNAGASSGTTFNGSSAVTISTNTIGAANLTVANAFTGANTFYNTTGQAFSSTAASDGIIVKGSGSGTGSWRTTLIPATLSANRTLTLPNVTGTVVTTGDTSTVTNAMLAGSIAYSKLTLSNSIVNADISSSAAIADSKLTGATAKAWVNFNGTGVVAMRANSNVSSITDTAVGAYTINFTTALSSANYAAIVTATQRGGGTTPGANISAGYGSSTTTTVDGTYSTTALQIYVQNSAGNGIDAPTVSVAVFL